MPNTATRTRRQVAIPSATDRMMVALAESRDALASVSEMAASTGLSPPAVTAALAELARAGALTRRIVDDLGWLVERWARRRRVGLAVPDAGAAS